MAVEWIKERDYAHRGLHGLSADCPENSLAAVEEAIGQGCGIEIDVQRSADYEAVAFHDATLNRMTDRIGPVANFPAAMLGAIALQGTSQVIPTLNQVLGLVNGRVPLLVEIKSVPGMPGVFEQRIATLLESYRGPIAVMSMSPTPLAWLGILAPRVPLGNVVTSVHRSSMLRKVLGGATKLVRAAGGNAIARSDFAAVERILLGHGSLDGVRERGKPLLAWTIRSANEASGAREHADALIFEGFRPERR